MASLLFIDHIYHKMTQSTNFLLEIFKIQYDVTTFYLDPLAPSKKSFQPLKGKFFDVVVCFQLMPPRKELELNVSYNHGVFFPMYDAIPPLTDPKWYEYHDFQIICFCKKLYEELSYIGFSAYYIQYFPPPNISSQTGDLKSAFFWQRRKEISFPLVEALLSRSDINHIHWHNVPDPKQDLAGPSPVWKSKVSQTKWFDSKNDLIKKMEESALYFAPRHQEGIGQSFLEAMALGRCVIAPDAPTMNEYIQHEVTGFLYQPKAPKPIHLSDILKIQSNTIAFMQNGHQVWIENKIKILQWIKEPVQNKKTVLNNYYKTYNWKYVWPHTKIPLLSVSKNRYKFVIRIFGIQVVKKEKNLPLEDKIL